MNKVHQARDRHNGDPPVSFECKTFFANSTAEDGSLVNTRKEFASSRSSSSGDENGVEVSRRRGGCDDDDTVHNTSENELDE